MSGAPLITHRTIPAAIITRTRKTPSMINGTSSRSQKRGLRFGDIDGTLLFRAWTGGSTGHAEGRGSRGLGRTGLRRQQHDCRTEGSRCLRKVITLSRPSFSRYSGAPHAAKGPAARHRRSGQSRPPSRSRLPQFQQQWARRLCSSLGSSVELLCGTVGRLKVLWSLLGHLDRAALRAGAGSGTTPDVGGDRYVRFQPFAYPWQDLPQGFSKMRG